MEPSPSEYKYIIFFSLLSTNKSRSDALGHVLNMLGRDWTHPGVAKLFTDICANGYNIMYLTSRSVGQADTTRAYLHGINQDGNRLPRGPVILSPDRTFVALRREVYLRKPEMFKMACLRDIGTLFGDHKNPFYAGFGNRLTDAMSYRSVNIPSNRIFTINPNAEVSIDILTLNKYKSSYVSMRELVDHFFPPVGLLVKSGGEEFTDFNYWRSTPLELDDFSDSESDEEDLRSRIKEDALDNDSEDEGSEGVDDDQVDQMTESYMSRESVDIEEGGDLVDSIMESIEDSDLSRRGSLEDDYAGNETPLAVTEDIESLSLERGRVLRRT
jgi:phosphatidate phosphatase LPIN